MARALIPALCASIAVSLAAPSASALSLISRTDNAISAWKARSGESLWTHQPHELSGAWFELYSDALVVNGVVFPKDGGVFELELYLDPQTGARIHAPSTETMLARSDWRFDDIVLENGWKLVDFDPGNDQKLVFENDQGEVVWTLDTQTYPHVISAWWNTVFWSKSYVSDDGVVHAHIAGEPAEAWQFDVNTSLPELDEPLTRPYFRVIESELYVGAHEHVFLLDPNTGEVRKQWDLVALTGLPWRADFDEPGFFSGGLNIGTFSADQDTLIVGFERRVVAIDRSTGDLLWHRDPGSFPHFQYPLIHASKVYVLTERAADAQSDDATASSCGCRISGRDSREGRPWAFMVVGVIAAWMRRRTRA